MTFHTKLLWVKKPFCIKFDKIDGFIKIYDPTGYLLLFGNEKYDAIYDEIRYLTSEKRNGITYSISHNFARIKIDSYNSLPIEKTLIFYNVMILIKSVVNKSKNNYYYNMLLEKSMTINPIHSFLKKNICKCYIMIELTFLNKLILIKQVNQKIVIFVTIGSF